MHRFLIWTLAIAAVFVLVVTGVVGWRHVVEWHHLRRLETGSIAERKVAAVRLASMTSREGIARLLVLPPLEPPTSVCETDFYTAVLEEHGGGAVEMLFEALDHEEVRARYRAVAAIRKIKPPGATRALIGALVHADTQSAALNAIANLIPEPGEAIPALRAAIESESDALRAGAADALRRVKLFEEDILPAQQMLEQAVGDSVELVRIYSAWSLGEIGPRPESIPALVIALDDDVGNVRRAAARALAALGPDAAPAREALERALEDRGSSDVRKYAAEALAKIRAPQRPPKQDVPDGDRKP